MLANAYNGAWVENIAKEAVITADALILALNAKPEPVKESSVPLDAADLALIRQALGSMADAHEWRPDIENQARELYSRLTPLEAAAVKEPA